MDIVSCTFEQAIEQMTLGEKEMALEHLRHAIDAEMMEEAPVSEESPCPRCGCRSVVKAGRERRYQRYLCRGYSRGFSCKTDRILARSRLPRETWAAFARCMIDRYSLRETASVCSVSLKTAFFMRHRVCEMMSQGLDSFRANASCTSEIDERYLHESFCGNHTRSNSFAMPRKARKRSSDMHIRGISDELMCILSGVNDHGDCFLTLACRGHLSKDAARRILADRVAARVVVSTDKHPAYKKLMSELGAVVHNRYDAKDRSIGTINSVNALHSRLSRFLRPFNGVSSRRLSNYLVWFQWLESFKKLEDNAMRKGLAIKHIASGFYDTKWSEYKNSPYPFGNRYGWVA